MSDSVIRFSENKFTRKIISANHETGNTQSPRSRGRKVLDLTLDKLFDVHRHSSLETPAEKNYRTSPDSNWLHFPHNPWSLYFNYFEIKL